MIRPRWLGMVLVFALFTLSFAASQDGGFEKKKAKGPQDEDAKMAKLIEKAYKKPETERDKVIKEISKLAPEEPLGEDFATWFDRVATSRTEWDRTRIDRKQVAEIFDRIAERLQVPGDKITRMEFLDFAKRYWRADQSPLWKEPKELDLAKEAEKMFKHLDRNEDGYLSPAEMPEALRSDLRRWDKNGDGLINLDEYKAYFPHRLDRLHKEYRRLMDDGPRVVEIDENELDKRPTVIRAGKLPPGLPAWFEQLDQDRDGQVALYEWRVTVGISMNSRNWTSTTMAFSFRKSS